MRQLNELARNAKADYIVHTGDFGFYDEASLERIAEKYATDTPSDTSMSTDMLHQNPQACGPIFASP